MSGTGIAYAAMRRPVLPLGCGAAVHMLLCNAWYSHRGCCGQKHHGGARRHCYSLRPHLVSLKPLFRVLSCPQLAAPLLCDGGVRALAVLCRGYLNCGTEIAHHGGHAVCGTARAYGTARPYGGDAMAGTEIANDSGAMCGTEIGSQGHVIALALALP
eukprot:1699131-Rhodomonas_salina.1